MSDEKIIDVLDPSYPLMMMSKEKTPGTHLHGKNVSALLESLGTELKLDVHLLRIAGQFHDIGKTAFPKFFIENLTDEDINPHETLEPHISHKIITSHIGNTVQILINDSNIPVEAVRWVSQHHGNSVLRYFFQKSDQKHEDSYRYSCSVPNSLEAGLLMICDCLEAKTKALYQKENPPEVKDIVSSTFDELMNDCQLDEIELPKLSYIRVIKQVLTRELNSMYQSKRIDYDSKDKK